MNKYYTLILLLLLLLSGFFPVDVSFADSAEAVSTPAVSTPAVSTAREAVAPFLFTLPEQRRALAGRMQHEPSQETVPLLLFTEATHVLLEKCMACHTRNYTVPLYGKIPGLGSLVERDYKEGLRHVNFAAELAPGGQGKAVSEVFLAKVERALEDRRMPPPQYISAYLSAQLTEAEKKTLRTWIWHTRETWYATGLASPEYRTEPLQPLPDAIPTDSRKADLGARLFHDGRLSGNNAFTCASCHFLNHSGTDGKALAQGASGTPMAFNAPTVFNAALHHRQFWNGRARDLQAQALVPPSSPQEMNGGDWPTICSRLASSSLLVEAFLQVYPDGITATNVTNAIAEFEKTLLTPNCRFDRYLKGEKNVLSEAEQAGYAQFKAARCATCHVGQAIGGQSIEYLNLKADFYASRQRVPRPEDLGLYTYTGRKDDSFKFKTPSLRNITVTGPWYHDGSVTTLHEAVELMGVYQSGIQLDAPSVDLIVQFLYTLTGEYRGRLLRK